MRQIASGPERDGGVSQFLTFRLAGRRYALPAAEVGEVIRLPVVARVPQSPMGLLGLANLRGNVIPVASGRGLLGQGEGATDQGRAIVLADGANVALAVDRVEGLLQIAAPNFVAEAADIAALPGEALRGAFRDSSQDIVKILDLGPLIQDAFIPRQRRTEPLQRSLSEPAPAAPAQRREKLLAFEVDGQEFALPLGVVQEVAEMPALTTAVPHADDIVRGVIGFRDFLLPLLSVRGLLGLSEPGPGKNEKVVVAHIAGAAVGLVVDRMTGLLTAADDELDEVPEILAARIGGESKIRAIYRGAGTRRLVPVLDTNELFKDDVMRKLEAARGNIKTQVPDLISGKTIQLLVFRLAAEEYGVPIEAVQEVLQKPGQVARIPKSPKYLEGIINLRGEVLPVIDQRRRFNLPSKESTDGERLVVVRAHGVHAALIVDSVSEVFRVSDTLIEAAPRLAGEKNPLVRGVINLGDAGRIIFVLDPPELLTRAEQDLLGKFTTKPAELHPT